jgi:formylmethanofuran dehydrogenase subunit A
MSKTLDLMHNTTENKQQQQQNQVTWYFYHIKFESFLITSWKIKENTVSLQLGNMN